MPPTAKPCWQATALITLGAGGVVTGLSLVPKAAPAELTSPASLPIKLMAMQRADAPQPGGDGILRSSVVHVARHFLRLAETRSPAEMEALIWQYASSDGVDHGQSCAAFASLTLELGAQLAGQQSWVTGGTSYPWPLHSWVDGRVDPNPASLGVVSVLQDARDHGRWHPLGDGYSPQPGDWVLFDGHVEVVTSYQGGVLHTIGGDSVPNMSVNAHEYPAPLQGQGVAGFVDNGLMGPAPAKAHGSHANGPAAAPGGQAGSGDLASSFGVSAAAAPTPPEFGPPSASHGGSARGTVHPAGQAAAPGHRPAGGQGALSRNSGSSQGAPARPRAAARGPAAAGPAGASGRVTKRGSAAGGATSPDQVVLAPRAISVPPEAPPSPYGPLSRALRAQGAKPASDAVQGSRPQALEPRVAAVPLQPSQRPQAARQPAGRTDPARQQAGAASDPARRGKADVPATGLRMTAAKGARPGGAAIPGLLKRLHHDLAGSAALAPYHRHDVPAETRQMPGTASQQAFIQQVARGAMATQRKYGVPASVTIAQAIDESGWGQSVLATGDHNLFGIKGTGPAGTDVQPTQEVINGIVVNTSAPFRVYQDIAQSIDSHGKLLATSGDYAAAMAQRHDPNAFAAALTGVYATDPGYGAKLIQLMQQYNLYRYDAAASPGTRASGAAGGRAAPAGPVQAGQAHAGQGHAANGHAGRAGSPASPADSGSVARPRFQYLGRAPKNGGAEIPGLSARPTRPGPIARPSRSATPGHASPEHGHSPIPTAASGSRPSAGQARIPGVVRAPHADLTAHQAGTVQPDPVANSAPAPVRGRTARPGRLPHPAWTERPPHLPDQAAPRSASSQPGAVHADGAASRPAGHGGLAQPVRPSGGTAPGEASATANGAMPGKQPATSAPAAHPRPTVRDLRPTRPPATIYRSRPTVPAGASAAILAAGLASGAQGQAAIPGLAIRSGAGQPTGPRADAAAAAGVPVPSYSAGGGSSIPGISEGVPGGRAGAPNAAAGRQTAPTHPAGTPIRPAAAAGQSGRVAGLPDRQASRPATTPRRAVGAAAWPVTAPATAAAPPGNAIPPGGSAIPGAGNQGAGPRRAVRATANSQPGSGTAVPGWGQGTAQAGPVGQAAVPGLGHRAAGTRAPAPGAGGSAAQSRVAHGGQGRPAAASAVPAARSGRGQAARGAPRPNAPPAAAATAVTAAAVLYTAPAARKARQASSGSPERAPAAASVRDATLAMYHAHLPLPVRDAVLKSAKPHLTRAEPLYADVARDTGIRWEILAACDWMQCKARHGHSPVYGERLGVLNDDGTCYRTRSAALQRCAYDLVELARSVYRLDVATSRELSIRDLASVFAAYRWGSLLKQHNTSAMDFPYSVAGLTADHMHMRWPNIDEPDAPDRPGRRFGQPFGAVPVVLSLNYQALA